LLLRAGPHHRPGPVGRARPARFLGPFLRLDPSALLARVFIAAMISLCSALVSFLREILIATRHLRIGAS
jgi:hypothetical protein